MARKKLPRDEVKRVRCVVLLSSQEAATLKIMAGMREDGSEGAVMREALTLLAATAQPSRAA